VGIGIPDIAGRARPDIHWARAKIATLIQAEVQPIDLVPSRAQDGNHDSSDVAAVTGHQHPHKPALLI
jgi:hypothetical protein